MIDFVKKINEIDNKENFISFVELLVSNLKNKPNEWSNITLLEYLEALISYTEDLDGYYFNKKTSIPENINWQLFANILIGAKMYE